MKVSWHHYLGTAVGTRSRIYTFGSRHTGTTKAKRD